MFSQYLIRPHYIFYLSPRGCVAYRRRGFITSMLIFESNWLSNMLKYTQDKAEHKKLYTFITVHFTYWLSCIAEIAYKSIDQQTHSDALLRIWTQTVNE